MSNKFSHAIETAIAQIRANNGPDVELHTEKARANSVTISFKLCKRGEVQRALILLFDQTKEVFFSGPDCLCICQSRVC